MGDDDKDPRNMDPITLPLENKQRRVPRRGLC